MLAQHEPKDHVRPRTITTHTEGILDQRKITSLSCKTNEPCETLREN